MSSFLRASIRARSLLHQASSASGRVILQRLFQAATSALNLSSACLNSVGGVGPRIGICERPTVARVGPDKIARSAGDRVTTADAGEHFPERIKNARNGGRNRRRAFVRDVMR